MSVRTVWRKGVRSVAIPAVAGLLAAGAGALPSASAAGISPARSMAPGLHGAPAVALGSTTNIFKNIFTEGPDGTVFYSKGSVIYVVKGTSAPQIALHARAQVLALAANTFGLFVETGLTVTEYRRSDGSAVRHWTLTSPVTPITYAGMIVVGNTLWSWTDWATDSSGFEFARLSRIVTTASTVHVVDKQAYPVDMAADSSGLYFQDARGTANTGYLVHDTPTGGITARKAPVDAVMALAGGRLYELANHTNGHQYIDGYSTSTLTRVSSAQISSNDRVIAGTNLGMLVLSEPCTHLTCPTANVSRLASSGAVSGTLTVPGAFYLLSGPSASVVEVRAGKMYLVRISA